MIRMGLSVSSATPAPPSLAPLELMRGPTPSFRLIASAASLRFISLSLHKKLSRLCHVPQLRELGFHSASLFRGINFFQFSGDVFASSFFNGGGNRKGSFNTAAFRSNLVSGRQWTNVLLGINILVYVAQVATQGRLLLLGAKINSLIDKGQIWRLVTSSVLHANIGHLLINCYSLNSVGPTIEKLTGPRRFLAVYFAAAVASSTTSYFLCKGPSVGASGAIFGLVGSLAMFVIRHRDMIGGGKEDLQQIAKVIFLNMAIGLLSTGIDNWGHLGGLVGGFATSWLIGPAWKFEKLSKDGRRIFVDKAPIKYLANRKKT